MSNHFKQGVFILSFLLSTAASACCCTHTNAEGCNSAQTEADCTGTTYNSLSDDNGCSCWYCGWTPTSESVNGGVCAPTNKPASC